MTVHRDNGWPARDLHHLTRYSPGGFAWGANTGLGASDLALSILADAIGLNEADAYFGRFKYDIILKLPNEWTLTQAQINTWLAGQL